MYANLDDINANLDGQVVAADQDNTALIHISVERIIRGYLSRVVSNSTMFSWDDPDSTPEIIREIAGKLIASRLFFVRTLSTAITIDETHYAQRLYNEAIALLAQIVSGEIIIPNIIVEPVGQLDDLDFFPVDDTDRAFTVGMEL